MCLDMTSGNVEGLTAHASDKFQSGANEQGVLRLVCYCVTRCFIAE